MDLYYQMFGELEGEKENSTPVLGEWNPVPHRGIFDTSVFEQLRYAARRMIFEIYVGYFQPPQLVSHTTPIKYERNEEIRLRHLQGETLMNLADFFHLSESRVWQIIHNRRK